MAARVFAWYGVTSAGLAAVAVHGTILMVVRRRRRDLAIRLALGAERALPVAAFVGLTVLGGAVDVAGGLRAIPRQRDAGALDVFGAGPRPAAVITRTVAVSTRYFPVLGQTPVAVATTIPPVLRGVRGSSTMLLRLSRT